jgi:hypothetical protein
MTLGAYNAKNDAEAYQYATAMTNGSVCSSGYYYMNKYRQDRQLFLGNPQTTIIPGFASTTVSVSGASAYPFINGPTIDINLKLTFEVSEGRLSITGTYGHNTFPDYELYLEQWRDGVLVATHPLVGNYMSEDDGPGPINLGLKWVAYKVDSNMRVIK